MLNRPPRRVRFLECVLERTGDSLRALVTVADGDAHAVTGTAERAYSREGDLWCAAEATVTALLQLYALEVGALALHDVVAFEISGAPAVAISLRAHVAGQQQRLFGLTQADEDRGRAAALSVLSATNRFFANG
jgi:hypothetical protein